jgi:hypothetical protein
MSDGSCLAFFEAPDQPFEFKRQHDFDLHIAPDVLQSMFAKGQKEGIETRGISDHGSIHSIYFRDPNGYVVELTTPVTPAAPSTPSSPSSPSSPEAVLDAWQARKQRSRATFRGIDAPEHKSLR